MKIIKDILDIDKKTFKQVFLYGVCFFILFYAVAKIFSFVFQKINVKLISITGTADLTTLAEEQLIPALSSAKSVIFLIFAVSFLFLILEIYNYSFFENLMWNTIFKKKTTWKNTNKFLGLNIILTAIFLLVIALIFLLISKLPGNLIKFGAMMFYLVILFAFYLLFVGYISFGKTHEIFKSVKNAFVIGVKHLDLTIIPLLIATIISIIINLVFSLFTWLPDAILLSLQAVIFAAYLAWFRIYLSNALKSVKF